MHLYIRNPFIAHINIEIAQRLWFPILMYFTVERKSAIVNNYLIAQFYPNFFFHSHSVYSSFSKLSHQKIEFESSNQYYLIIGLPCRRRLVFSFCFYCEAITLCRTGHIPSRLFHREIEPRERKKKFFCPPRWKKEEAREARRLQARSPWGNGLSSDSTTISTSYTCGLRSVCGDRRRVPVYMPLRSRRMNKGFGKRRFLFGYRHKYARYFAWIQRQYNEMILSRFSL